MSDFKKYIIGVVAFCIFCKCPLLFFIGTGIAIVWWLISNVVLEIGTPRYLPRETCAV